MDIKLIKTLLGSTILFTTMLSAPIVAQAYHNHAGYRHVGGWHGGGWHGAGWRGAGWHGNRYNTYNSYYAPAGWGYGGWGWGYGAPVVVSTPYYGGQYYAYKRGCRWIPAHRTWYHGRKVYIRGHCA